MKRLVVDPAEQTNVGRIDYFLRQNFDYPSGTFDGVLLWDSLQFMSPALLNEVVERLYDVMAPKSYLLAFFTGKGARHGGAVVWFPDRRQQDHCPVG